jgi:hypothetical protein
MSLTNLAGQQGKSNIALLHTASAHESEQSYLPRNILLTPKGSNVSDITEPQQ